MYLPIICPFFLYIIIFFIITALLSVSGLDFITSISGAATSISNVGPGIGSVIGPGGKNIQELQKETETTVVINEEDEKGIVEILGVVLDYEDVQQTLKFHIDQDFLL